MTEPLRCYRHPDRETYVKLSREYAELGPDIARKVGEPVTHRRATPPEVADGSYVPNCFGGGPHHGNAS